MSRLIAAAVLLAILPLAIAQAASLRPEIRTSDVDLFYSIYDAAAGHPRAADLQRDYIDAGSPGVREFVAHRIISGEQLAQTIEQRPAVYAKARTCLAALPEVRSRLNKVFRRLLDLYSPAKFPPVTILIGRNNTGGTTGPTGVLVGLESVCATIEPGETPADRLVHVIAHEYAHVEQTGQDDPQTLLEASLTEGVAELVAELTSGSVSNRRLFVWTKGRESHLGEAFRQDASGSDFSKWLYNGRGSEAAPGDLGYWAGYEIARNYFNRAQDKRKALRQLLELRNPEKIWLQSGWYVPKT